MTAEEIIYQDYCDTKEKVENTMQKLGIQNIKQFKSWLKIQEMRIFELESFEQKYKNQ